MELLKSKIESLVNRIDDTDVTTDDRTDRMKELKVKISENQLLCEDLKRRSQATKQRIASTNTKNVEIEEQIRGLERKIEANDKRINQLENEAEQRDERFSELEEKTSRSKLEHMELSGAYEDARSRRQLLLNEVEKVKQLTEKNVKQAIELESRLVKSNSQIEELTESSVRNESFGEHAENATMHIDRHIKQNNSKECLAKTEIRGLENEIEKKQKELDAIRMEREKMQNEMKQMLAEIDEF